jgi:CelD/BcsL family acetyltransferase involved in cellulose biosynthesis
MRFACTTNGLMKTLPRVAWAGLAGHKTGAQRDVAARVRVREANSRSSVALQGRVATAPSDGAVDILCITHEFGLPHWSGAWRRLLLASRSPEKLYQTPEFFRFLSDSQTATSDRFELYVIKDRAQDKVIGMVPVRISSVALDFNAAGLTVFSHRTRVIRLLGSVPLMPDDGALLHRLFAHLLQCFPGCAAVSMQALPREMERHLGHDMRHVPFVVHGWRACHTIPLPDSLPAYMGKMSAKKRYNLAREYRLLQQAAGPLELCRLDRSTHVRDLVDAIAALAPAHSSALMGARDYRVLAANRLLLSYVLRSAGEVVAVVAGSRYGDTWHIHQVMYAPAYRRLSAGSVALHAALQDVITQFAFTTADLGFGTPRHQFASTHVLKARAHVLVARQGTWSAWLLRAFVRADALNAACVKAIKPLVRRFTRG